MQRGVVQIVVGYTLWGLSPIYWKVLSDIGAVDVIAVRSLGTLVVLVLVHTVVRSWPTFRTIASSTRNLVAAGSCAALLSLNWGLYIWAVNTDRVTEAALGYFINPLVSVALGVVVLRERLRRGQAMSVAVAAMGVLYLTLRLGSLPWIPLTLALSFAAYGLIRKQVSYESLDGLTLESFYLLAPALGFLVYRWLAGAAPLGDGDPLTTAIVVLAGPLTAIPLLLFAAGARKVPLNVVGIAQFLVPTLQFLLGIVAYGESFGVHHLIGYSLIWVGVVVFAADTWRAASMDRMRLSPHREGVQP